MTVSSPASPWGLLLVVLMTMFIFVLAATYSRISLDTLDPMVEETKAAALRRAKSDEGTR